MAGRPVDHQRRAELLDAVVDYTVEHGFSEVSWRPVAAALGVSPTTLVHHFGTKEQMLVAILGRLRERIRAATSDLAGQQPGLSAAARAAWERASDPRQWAEFRLFFAVYGRALQAPEQFEGFLDRVVADWMSDLASAQGPGADPAAAARTATLVIATIRGLLLDLLATGDRERVQDAAESFLATLDQPRGAPLPAFAAHGLAMKWAQPCRRCHSRAIAARYQVEHGKRDTGHEVPFEVDRMSGFAGRAPSPAVDVQHRVQVDPGAAAEVGADGVGDR